jgi:hypothetical protein
MSSDIEVFGTVWPRGLCSYLLTSHVSGVNVKVNEDADFVVNAH